MRIVIGVLLAALLAGPAQSAPVSHPGALVVADAEVDSVFRISILTERVVSAVASPTANPRGIAFDGSDLWMIDYQTPKALLRLDLDTAVTLGSFPWPGAAPTGLTWDGTRLWVADAVSDTIYTVDISTGARTSRFRTPGRVSSNPNPSGLAWDGEALWVVDSSRDRLYRVSAATGDSLLSFAVPSDGVPNPNPWGLAWDGSTLWLSDVASDLIYQIDPVSGSKLSQIEAPAGSAYGLAHLAGGTAVQTAGWGRVKRLYRP
jgi:DNA-binding beta-propeller fold protein YncE